MLMISQSLEVSKIKKIRKTSKNFGITKLSQCDERYMGASVVHHFYVDTIAKAMFLKASLYRLFCTVTFIIDDQNFSKFFLFYFYF